MKHVISDGFPFYIELTENQDFKALFNANNFLQLYNAISEQKSAHRYAEGKWSIKQIIGHITDHERIMTYRALRFSRGDKTQLSGYDQDTMVGGARFDELSWADLVQDYKNVRQASNSFIKGLSGQQLLLTGQAWKYTLTVEDFLRATIGHEMHHIKILKERYLQ